MAVLRRLPLDLAVAVVLPATVLLFAFGSSSVPRLVRIGSGGRWVALVALAALALARLAVRGARGRAFPVGWAFAAALLVLGAESTLWSVDARATAGRIFTLGVLFAAAAALALGVPDVRLAATRALEGVLAGIALVAVASLVVLVVAHRDAVLPATAGAGWRFQGLGQNPNTVAMLLAVGLPLAVWAALARRGRIRWLGIGLVLLFAGEIAFSGSRGGLIAGFAGGIATALALGRSARAKIALASALAALAFACLLVSRLPSPARASPAAASAASARPAAHRGIDAQQAFRLEDEVGYPLKGLYDPSVPRTVMGSSGRAQAWDGAWHQGLHRPIAGYGFGTESHVFVDRFYAFEGDFVENTYLGLFLQLGAVGVVLLAALLLALVWSALRLVLTSALGEAGPAGAAIGVLVAAMVVGAGQSGLLAAGNIAASSVWICVLTLPILARAAAT